jgi:HD-GYP domain
VKRRHLAGVTDELWLEAVRLHDDASLAAQPIAQLQPAQQMAMLLHRVERYGALISRRAGREALSPTQAAQQVCLGADGRPDMVGALLLKVMSLYPPGSYVSLASNEVGIVLARGDHVRQPIVAALRNAQGMTMAEPRLRYTAQAQSAVRAALRPSEVSTDPPLAKLQELRSFLRSAQAVSPPAAPAANSAQAPATGTASGG